MTPNDSTFGQLEYITFIKFAQNESLTQESTDQL